MLKELGKMPRGGPNLRQLKMGGTAREMRLFIKTQGSANT